MSRISRDGHCVTTAANGVLGALAVMLLVAGSASGGQTKLKKITHETYALTEPHFIPGADKKSRTRQMHARVSAKSKRVILGHAAWVCTPSGFGRKASCVARNTFG
jgi:alkylation response protein AidB-like acyl-CoA dehydrogenase